MYTTQPLAGSATWTGLSDRDSASLNGRYEILGEIGRGGMGSVLRARHKALDMQVAIKVTLPGAPVERFLREAKLLARIKSPYVVGVHDFAVLPDGCPMIVMEWVEGTDLAKLLKAQAGPLPEERVLPWMRQICEGMVAAAEQGIIHRDLKPSNILIDAQGRARVADFGLARGGTDLRDLTLSSGVLGTPYYMAPEQAESPRSVDARADVYSFGATFYHALTGLPPFDGETAFSVLFKHKAHPLVRPKARNPKLSVWTSDLLERCLAKAPGDRFASFAEILGLLQARDGNRSPWDAGDEEGMAHYLSRYQERRAAYLRCERGLEDAYEFPGGQVLRILEGDIVRQHVDVLVSSDTCQLGMSIGVSEAIRLAGGPVIAQEARRYAPVRTGRAVVTSAGALPARFVFHGVTVGRDWDYLRASRDLISEIMASCFYHAASLYVQTIAFPLLGTGGAGFERDECLDAMFRILVRTFLHSLTPVREARIILFPVGN
jgi:O-acetyl-ADP-ribose deacetylase (regulator of RNase III)/tRNA A-37 threonylcarbamoyl transferase component Bud32